MFGLLGVWRTWPFKQALGTNQHAKIMDAADRSLEGADIIHLPDRFNAAFAEHGWIATSSISADAMRTALDEHEKGNIVAAEEVLLDWVLDPETINLLAITRSKSFSNVHGRWHQMREALELTKEGRYLSAIPLVLIVCDGFGSDQLGVSSLFARDTDLSLFDSIVGHPSSLPALIGRIKKGVHKSSSETLSLPLRHGILHGRSTGYANRAVCGKAWMLMIALVDWAADRRDEKKRRAEDQAQRSMKWSDVCASLRKTRADRAAIEAFVPRQWDGPLDGDLDKDDPPFAFREFLDAWQARNFGRMAEWAANPERENHGRLAGLMRENAEYAQLVAFEILSVSQMAIAGAKARVRMRGRSLKGDVGGTFLIPAFRERADGDGAMPGDVGCWRIPQRCIFDLMNERSIETSEPNCLKEGDCFA